MGAYVQEMPLPVYLSEINFFKISICWLVMYMRNNTGRKFGYGFDGFPLVLHRLYRNSRSLCLFLEKQVCGRLQQNSIIHEAATFLSSRYI